MIEKMKSTAVFIYFAIGCGMLGILMSFVLFYVCIYFNIDIFQNLWLITLPVILAVFLNILFIELYFGQKRK
jgi:hypothetical protein